MVAAPHWARSMKPGRWYQLSGDRPDLGLAPTRPKTRYLMDCDPAREPTLNRPTTIKERIRRRLGRDWKAPWHGRMGFSAITEAWNGAVFASRFGESGSMVVFGGGHNTYFGSDVHAFDLFTREWHRISDGFVVGSAEDYGAGASYPDAEYPDGSPLPPHTYGYVQYDAIGNDLLLSKGNSELGPNVRAVAIPHMFNLDRLRWRRGARHPKAILNSGGFTTWDAARRVLWGHSGDDGGGNAFVGFYPDGTNSDGSCGRWGPLFPNKFLGAASHSAMQIDPLRDIIVVAVPDLDRLFAINPADPAAPAVPLHSTGDKPRISEHASLEYASTLDRFVYYSAENGGTLYTITAPQASGGPRLTEVGWDWTRIVGRGGDPVAAARASSRYAAHWRHTYGRFRIATWGSLEVALLIRHIDTPMYALRLN